MCGHAGIIIGNPLDFFTDTNYRLAYSAKAHAAASLAAVLLSEAQSFRGGDGFGVMALSKLSLVDSVTDDELGVSFVKKVDPFKGEWASVIDNTKVFEEPGVICMHARKMTAGQKVFAATHPIHVDHITLMHNGSVPDWQRLFPKAGSDTIGLAQMLANRGIQPVAEEIVGAKTLVWLDSTHNTLNIFKHEERPLYMCRTGSSYIYASEKWMVFKALDQNNLPEDEWIDFKDQYHYQYNVETGTWNEPVKYNVPVRTYNMGHSKKNELTENTGTAGNLAGGAGNVVSTQTAIIKNDVVLTKGTKLIARLNSITQKGQYSLLEGRVAFSHDLTPPDIFVGKKVIMRVPTKYYNAFAGAVKSGVFVATTTFNAASSYASEILCDSPYSLAILFDKTLTTKELDKLIEVVTTLYDATKRGEVAETFYVSCRSYLEWLDAFEMSKERVLGTMLSEHPKRVNGLVPNKSINIPVV